MVLTCDSSKQASSSVLPISYPSLNGTGLQPGRSVFVGQYLFTGGLYKLLSDSSAPSQDSSTWALSSTSDTIEQHHVW